MRTQYAQSDGVSIAYQVFEDNGMPLLHIPGAISNLAMADTHQTFAQYYERLSRYTRLIRFDRRATGLSDRGVAPSTVQEQVTDIDAILDCVGVDRVAAVGYSQGASLAVYYAAIRPERVTHLVLVGTNCGNFFDPEKPVGPENRRMGEWVLDLAKDDFETFARGYAQAVYPDAPESEVDAMEAHLRATANPQAYKLILEGIFEMDLRPYFAQVQVPTLVVQATGDAVVPPSHAQLLVDKIADARLVEFDTTAHMPWLDPKYARPCMAAIEEFLTGSTSHSADRVVATVLFTDIVDSTAQQQRRGDTAWSALRENFEANNAKTIAQFNGRVVQFTGDGVMAEFPAPGDALRAAQALVIDAEALGVQIRAGVHSGEAYRVDDQLYGTCVTMAARVSAQADKSEIFTTQVVEGLVEGSGFEFEYRGAVNLKGIGARKILRLL